jgi:hypothetical protein
MFTNTSGGDVLNMITMSFVSIALITVVCRRISAISQSPQGDHGRRRAELPYLMSDRNVPQLEVQLSLLNSGDQSAEGPRPDHMCVTIRILAVPDRYGASEHGHLDTGVFTTVATTALAPTGAGQICTAAGWGHPASPLLWWASEVRGPPWK